METQELMKIWQEQDNNLNDKIQINQALLKEVSFNKVNSLLREYRNYAIFELVVDVLSIIWLVGFISDYLDEKTLLFHAGLLLVFTYGGLLFGIYKLIQLAKIHHSAPILETQKRIERLRIMQRREINLLYIMIPLSSLSFLVVFISWVTGLNIHELVGFKWQIYYFLGSAVVGIIIVTLMKVFPDKKMESAHRLLSEIKDYEA